MVRHAVCLASSAMAVRMSHSWCTDGMSHVLVRVDLFGGVCPRRSYGTPQGVQFVSARITAGVGRRAARAVSLLRRAARQMSAGPAHCLGFCPRRAQEWAAPSTPHTG